MAALGDAAFSPSPTRRSQCGRLAAGFPPSISPKSIPPLLLFGCAQLSRCTSIRLTNRNTQNPSKTGSFTKSLYVVAPHSARRLRVTPYYPSRNFGAFICWITRGSNAVKLPP
ncbi:hypothetical protein JAAARDRAFT_434023, partial [Jaapia argillacea MUCL 33604]